ncbi:MAG: hypothetical protein ACR2QZ_07425 [Woeseiaceae bacterium]
MNESYAKNSALVLLPPVTGGRLQDRSLRTWLAQSDLVRIPTNIELLAQVTTALGLPYPEEGLAALRMWGQTGERPTVWIAAADPVYLEPRLDHLCLHDLSATVIAPGDFRTLIQHLQETLASDKRFGFIRLGQCGYLRAATPMPTAQAPAYVVDQQIPSDYLPEGRRASAYRNLLSEVEMSLHDHEVNQRRMEAGHSPINSLWLWGGGFAPPRETRARPAFYGNDPLLLGYWDSANASANLWPGAMADCLQAQNGEGFVAVTPAERDGPVFLEDCLRQLRDALRQESLDHVTVLFRDGLRADLSRSQRMRFWRRDSRWFD